MKHIMLKMGVAVAVMSVLLILLEMMFYRESIISYSEVSGWRNNLKQDGVQKTLDMLESERKNDRGDICRKTGQKC